MAASYIPNRDVLFANWLANFATLIAASPSSYGLVAADAAAISAQNTAFAAALTAATEPGTRTPATVAQKDVIKAQALIVVRPYAQRINNNAGVTNDQRAALGLTIRKTVPTPIPAPTSAPALSFVMAIPGAVTLSYKDPMAPAGKAKPYGVTHCQVYTAVGATQAIDPSQADYHFSPTKSPFLLPVQPTSTGKIITVFARWQTKSGPGGIAQNGPWSAPLAFVGM